MKRIFAYRPLLFSALYLCLGLLGAYFVVSDKMVELVISIILFSILPVIQIVNFFIIKPISKPLPLIFCKFSNFCSKHFRIMAICTLCSVLGFSLFNISSAVYLSNRLDNTNCYLYGTISKSVVDKDTSLTFYLRDCTAYLENGTQYELDGLVRVFSQITQGNLPQKVEIGGKIGFKTTLNATTLLTEDKNVDSFNYKFNIKHTCVLKSSALSTVAMAPGSAKIDEVVNLYVLDMLLNSMDSENAYLAWSVLFGDSTQLNENVLEAFKISGVMHIIAVSGMNVVFIIAIILVVLKLARVRNKKVQLIACFAVLLFYCWLCAFTPSVVRASIMGMVFLFARLLGFQSDVLSNIAFSAIIILVIQPLMLFEPGFLLSYGSLIGIILLNEPIYKLFNKVLHLPKFLAFSFSSTISAQLGIMPITAMFFGYLSTYSVIANIIVVPIFEFGYTILFVLVIIVAIIPALSVLFGLLEIIFSFINWFPTLFVTLPFSTFDVFSIGLYCIVYMLILLSLSQYIFLKTKMRTISCIVLSVIFAFGFISTYSINLDKDYYSLSTYKSSSTIVLNQDISALVGMGADYRDSRQITDGLKAYRIYDLNSAVLWQESTDSQQAVANFMLVSQKVNPLHLVLGENYSNDYALIKWLDSNGFDYAFLSSDAETIIDGVVYKAYGSQSHYALYMSVDKIGYVFFSAKKYYDSYKDTIINYAKDRDSTIYLFYGKTVTIKKN